ncbi:DMT family transporter [Vibrio sp. Of7-15]|uniref:DMT family transporter n=1 Tax=Vibrio sp. Of7-15 TaxID=2724879 RepID=UPI001EF29CA0|nr:DMT family transporter [Vibrio sp. Of7-15]MCG7498998.1 DMT family transporter [Vibrio sp. Of7-15]
MIYLFPFIAVFIWSVNSLVNKLASAVIEPSAMSFYRWFFAMLLLTPFCLPTVIRQWHTVKPYLSKLAFLALLGMVLNQSLGYYAGMTTTASNMSLITSLVPLISVFLSVPLLGNKISALSVVGGVISLAGLTFMLGEGDVVFFFHQDITPGDGLMVLSAVVYAAYCVLLKRWKMPLNNWTVIYVQGLFAVGMLTPLWLSSDVLLPTQGSLPLIAYASIAASIIAPLVWVKAIEKIGAESSAMFMNLIPVSTVTLAANLLGETLYNYHFIGGVMVVSGVILSQIKTRKGVMKQPDSKQLPQ